VLVLPAALIFGLVMAVVASPANSDETITKPTLFKLGDFPLWLGTLFGKRHELLWLLSAMNETQNLMQKQQEIELSHPLSAPDTEIRTA
jgi:hypothetical protein